VASIGANANISVVIPEPIKQAVIVNSPEVTNVVLNSTAPEVIESLYGSVGSSGNYPLQIYRFDFSASLVWMVQHNKNTDRFQETLVNEDGERFFAKRKIIDKNAFMIVLTSAISGYVDVIFDEINRQPL